MTEDLIDIRELRIGNKLWFYKPLEPQPQILTVTGINKEDDIYFVYSNEYVAINEKGLKRIPLTPVILKACGFKKIGDGDFHNKLYKKDELNYSLDSALLLDYSGYYGHYCEIAICQYLHELQNAWFIVKREELEIKL